MDNSIPLFNTIAVLTLLSIAILIFIGLLIWSKPNYSSSTPKPSKETTIVNGVEVPNNCSLETMISISNSINNMKKKNRLEQFLDNECEDAGHVFHAGVCRCGKKGFHFMHELFLVKTDQSRSIMCCPIWIRKELAKKGIETFFELDSTTMESVEYVIINGKKTRLIELCEVRSVGIFG